MPLEEGSALALGHATPDSEFHLVVQRFCSTLPHDRAAAAERRGLALGGAPDEESVRVGGAAQGSRHPTVRFPWVCAAHRSPDGRMVWSLTGGL